MEKIRRYDLDWLRVIVFGLLIFYHVGMFFVPWGWHIKNNETYEWLKYPMLFLNQWRLPLLFVISGMGTAYALSFRSAADFIKERNLRLGIPLVFGILVIVPPQIYIERIVSGEFVGSYVDWMQTKAFAGGIYPEGNLSWHHLWFLPYLLVFSLILTPVFINLRNNPKGKVLSWGKERLIKNPWHLIWFAMPLFFYEACLAPYFEITHNLFWDWFNFISSMTLFLYGYVLIMLREVFWKALSLIWKPLIPIGFISFCTYLSIRFFIEGGLLVHTCKSIAKTVNLWVWILIIFGLASHYLNKKGRFITYANRAVYPFYILHQTITIIIGYYIYDKDWALLSKFSILVIGTFGSSWLLYEYLIRRVKLLWSVFGLKDHKR